MSSDDLVMEKGAWGDGETVGEYEGGELTLPMGLLDGDSVIRTVQLREITGKEEDILSDKALGKQGVSVQKVLAACITQLGPETNRKKIEALVPKLAGVDAVYLTIKLRQLSVFDRFDFKVPCTYQDCPGLTPAHVLLSERALKRWPTDEPLTPTFMSELAEGTPFEFRVTQLKDQPAIMKARKEAEDKLMSYVLWLQLVQVNGTKLASPIDLQKFTGKQRTAMRHAIAAKEVGVDMTVTHTCGECGKSFDFALPISAQASFFFPSAT